MQIEKEEQAAAEKAVGKEEFQGEWTAPVADFAQPEVADWSEGVQVPSVPIQQFPAPIDGKALPPPNLLCPSTQYPKIRQSRVFIPEKWKEMRGSHFAQYCIRVYVFKYKS